MPLAVDLLHPSPASERRKHKLKRLVPHPNSYFMDVKCPGCYKITTVFSHAQRVVVCAGCSTILCQPTGGRARLTEAAATVVCCYSCCNCAGNKGGNVKTASPLICLVPRGGAGPPGSSSGGSKPRPPSSGAPGGEFQFLGLDYLKKHFNLPQRALYLDQFRRPLITFPISGENTMNFNIDKKAKTNQMILDGFLAASEAITAPSVFPFAPSNQASKKEDEADEEIIYILQLPDWEFKCPVHNQTIRTPRFIWHSCKKPKSKTSGSESKQGPGPLHRPKPWIISRHTDFDYYSQW